MHLAKTLRNTVAPLHSASDEYRKNVIAVCNYVSAVVHSELPALKHEIPQWDEFSQKFVAAKSDALQWTNQVLEHLLATPADIASFNDAFLAGLADAISLTDYLIQHPGDTVSKQLLISRLQQLSRLTRSNISEVQGTLDSLSNFSKDLPEQAQRLSDIAADARAGAEVDKQKVEDLRADIKRLQADIAAQTAAIVGLGIVDGVAITLGIVAVAAAGPFGMVTWPFLGIAIAAATAFIVLAGIKIKDDQDKIASDQSQINEYTQDAAVLSGFADSFDQLSKQAEAVQENMRAIIAAWDEVAQGLEKVCEDLSGSEGAAGSDDFETVKADLVDAQGQWTRMIAALGNLAITINANDASIEPGMTGEEIKQATENAQTMSFIEFINQAA